MDIDDLRKACVSLHEENQEISASVASLQAGFESILPLLSEVSTKLEKHDRIVDELRSQNTLRPTESEGKAVKNAVAEQINELQQWIKAAEDAANTSSGERIEETKKLQQSLTEVLRRLESLETSDEKANRVLTQLQSQSQGFEARISQFSPVEKRIQQLAEKVEEQSKYPQQEVTSDEFRALKEDINKLKERITEVTSTSTDISLQVQQIRDAQESNQMDDIKEHCRAIGSQMEDFSTETKEKLFVLEQKHEQTGKNLTEVTQSLKAVEEQAASINSLTKEVSQVRERVTEGEETRRQIQATMDRLEQTRVDENVIKEDVLSTMDQRFDVLGRQHEEARLRWSEDVARLDQRLSGRIDELRESVNASKRSLERQLTSEDVERLLNSRIEDAQNNTTRQVNSLQRTCDECASNLERVKTTVTSTQERLGKLEAEWVPWKDETERQKTLTARLQERSERLEETSSDHSANQKEMENLLSKFEEKLRRLNHSVETSTTRIDNLQGKVAAPPSSPGQLSRLMQRVSKMEAEAPHQEEAVASLREDMESIRSAIASERSSREAVGRDYVRMHDNLLDRLNSAERTVNDAVRHRDTSLDGFSREVKTLASSLSQAMSTFERRFSEVDNNVRSVGEHLYRDLETLRSMVDKSKLEVRAEVSKANQSTSVSIDQLSKRVFDLEQARPESLGYQETLKSQLRGLQEQLRELKGRVDGSRGASEGYVSSPGFSHYEAATSPPSFPSHAWAPDGGRISKRPASTNIAGRYQNIPQQHSLSKGGARGSVSASLQTYSERKNTLMALKERLGLTANGRRY